MMKRKKCYLKHLNALLCIAILLLTTIPMSPVANAKDSQGRKIMVSLGDSYSAGEGIEKFYGQDAKAAEKVNDPDWLAHRSQNSWPGQLTLPSVNGKMSQNRGTNWHFVAVSGAETKHMTGKQNKKYKKFADPISDRFISMNGGNAAFVSVYDRSRDIDAQLDIFKQFEKGEVDYVTLTLGGNDAGFVDIVAQVMLGMNYFNKSKLKDMIDNIDVDKICNDLSNVYRKIHDEAGSQARIIVAGYPKLFDQNGRGAFVSKEEATLVNNAVSEFNERIRLQVEKSKMADIKICFVPVEGPTIKGKVTFDGHEAYSKDPFINKVILGKKIEDIDEGGLPFSAYSMHPNEKGAEVYRALVQEKINDIEKDDGQSEWSIQYPTEFDSVITLVCDVSGSMDDRVGTGETKLSALRQAGTVISGMVEDLSKQYPGNYGIGVVQFATNAKTLAFPHINYPYINSCIQSMADGGSTNITAGLKFGIDQLDNIKAKSKVIILMTDGQDNQSGRSAIMEQAEDAKSKNIRVFTVGFGSDADESILTQIADETGGEYRFADTNNIVGIIGGFMYAQQSAEAKVLTDQQGTVAQGEKTKAKPFTVPDDTGDLNSILYWPGSILDLIIVDPNGRTVDETYPGATINNTSIPASVVISDPLPGSWEMRVKGIETSYDEEPYYAITSFKRIDYSKAADLEPLKSFGAYCLPIGFFMMLICIMLMVFFNSKKNGDPN